MKITTERLVEIIKEDVDAYVMQEKLKGKQKDRKDSLESKGDERTNKEDEELKKLKHK